MTKKNKPFKNKNSSRTSYHTKYGIYLIILSIIVIFSFARTTNFDFVNIDDGVLIYENPLVINSNVSYWQCFEKNLFNVHYKPLVFLSWKAEYELFGSDPSHFHLINWLLHLINTVVLFFIANLLFQRLYSKKKLVIFSAFALALLFSINPLRIESVAWATERKDVLFSLFFLLSWLLYIHYLKNKHFILVIVSSILYLLSGLSKSMGLTLIAVIILTDFWYNRRFEFKLILDKLPYLFVFILLFYFYGLLNIDSIVVATGSPTETQYEINDQISSSGIITSLPIAVQWIITSSLRMILWMVHTFIPVKLSIIYPHDKIFDFLGISIFLFPVIVVLLLLWSWKKRKNNPAFLGGLLFFAITLSPALALSSFGQAIFLSDRYTYIPSIGLFFILIYGINRLKLSNTNYYALYITIFLFYFTLTLKNINHWKNSESLFTQALKVFPNSGLAHLNLGKYYREQNDFKSAFTVYNKGIDLSPGYYMLYSNRGKIFFDMGQYDRAIDDFDKCLSLKPHIASALANRGAAYAMKKQYDKSMENLNRALEIDPNNTNALSNRGFLLFKLNRYRETIKNYWKYLQLKPNDPDILNTIGLCYFNLNEFDKAVKEYNRAIQINPSEGIYFFNRSNALNAMGNKSNALKDAFKAQQLGIKVNPDYINNLKEP